MAHHNSRLFAGFLIAAFGNALPALAADPMFGDNYEGAVSYRLSDLDLRDPHVWINFAGCHDVTDTAFAGFSVNGSLQTKIQTDANSDGLLDQSYVQSLRLLSQGNGATGESGFATANCSAPMASSACALDASLPFLTVYTSQTAGTCLLPIAGTVRPYAPAVTNAIAPCFSTTAGTVTLNLSGIPITLQNAQIAATYVGDPASGLSNGLIIGFISETDANNTILPASLPLIGGQPLSSVLAGGSGNCSPTSDKEMVGGVVGWQFYLNFVAARVNYSK